MQLFLVRHGNTFGPDQIGGQRTFMSGCNNNIPLVKTGREQAVAMAQYLQHHDYVPTVLYANHLIRTWEHASIIRDYFYLKQNHYIPLCLDEHLLELDYGTWAGLTTHGETAETNEVIATFGLQAWEDWQQRRMLLNNPPHNWQITEAQLVASIQTFFNYLIQQYSSDDVIIAMGSQGSLAFVNALFEGGMAEAIKQDRHKVKTGHFCHLRYSKGTWLINSWNQNPKN